MSEIIPTVTPGEVNASGDYIRGLAFPARSAKPAGETGSRDRMELFFHLLKGSESTIRNWNTRDEAGKLAYLNAATCPERDKNQTIDEYNENVRRWRYEMLGILFSESLASPPNRLVAQAAFDALFPGRVGKR